MGSIPSPPISLDGHCSAIYNNTLYAFQWNAFQSISLQQGAKWSQLPMGVAVNGSRCVLGQWAGQDALIVVGGTTTNASDALYPGLQRFDFANKTWTSSLPGASVTQNRQMHGATYLNSTNSILVYSGFQDNSFTNSSETFTISTQEPFTMKSFPAQSPPAMSPIVLPWNASHGVMVGGSPDNKNVWVFSEATGWQQIQISLPSDVGNMSAVQGSIIQGDNDAKVLQLFDMASTPNRVSTLLVQSSNDQPASKSIMTGKVIIEDGNTISSRQVDFANWPAYNGSQAPDTSRSGFSLAQATSGLVLISGGTSDVNDSMCMFNQSANSWVNAKAFFSGQADGPSAISTPSAASTDSPPTATSAASAASSTASSSTGSDGLPDTSRIILGSILGGLAGLAAIALLILLLLRYRKARQRPKMYTEDKRQMPFGDNAFNHGFGDRKTSAASTKSSSNGGFFSRNQSPENLARLPISNPQLVSDSRTTDRDLTNARSLEPGVALGTPRGDVRNTGWSSYFNEGGNNGTTGDTWPDAVIGKTVSRQMAYSTPKYNRKSSTASIHPVEGDLELINSRSSGYPQSEESWEKSKFHPQSVMSSTSYRPGTAISHFSEEVPESYLDPASSSSGTQTWDPVGAGDGTSDFNRRAPSSIYADSINFPHPGDKVYIPGVSDLHVSQGKESSGFSHQPSDNRGMRTMATRDFGMGPVSEHPAQAGANSSMTQDDRPPIQSDMSWLNLGHQ